MTARGKGIGSERDRILHHNRLVFMIANGYWKHAYAEVA